MEVPTRIVKQKNDYNVGTVIFLHGSCSSGSELVDWLQAIRKGNAAFDHLKIVLPTAPARPFSLKNGLVSSIWFDRTDLSPSSPEDLKSIDATLMKLMKLIDAEVEAGIPKKNIILGGFSMGGAMAMQLAYRFQNDLGGVFALSSYLNNNSIVYRALRDRPPFIPPMFYCHGDKDTLIPIEWGERTAQNLKNLGVNVQFNVIKNADHELQESEIDSLYAWIEKIIPRK